MLCAKTCQKSEHIPNIWKQCSAFNSMYETEQDWKNQVLFSSS